MYVIFFFLIFIISFLLTAIVKFIAEKKSLLDIPNERSSHQNPTVRGGGIAIAITWFNGISYLFYFEKIDANLYYALISGILISIIGFIDDVYNVKFYFRLTIQSVAAIIALYFLAGLSKIDFGFYIIENKFLLTVLAFVGTIWFINLYNFIDGIDGYAASEAIFVSLALWFFTDNIILLLLSVSVFGFLPWNWQKAKIFMGDTGSTLLGFTLAVLAIYFQNKNEFSILNSLVLTSLFWFDATYTLIKRLLNKEQITEAHKKHIYQRIVLCGFSHQKTVLYSICINFILFFLIFSTCENNSYTFAVFAVCLILLFLITYLVNKKYFIKK